MVAEIKIGSRQLVLFLASFAIILTIGLAVGFNDPPIGGVPSVVGHSVDEVDLGPIHVDSETGYVGIGTANPDEHLHIVNTTGPAGLRVESSSSTWANVNVMESFDTGWGFDKAADNKLHFRRYLPGPDYTYMAIDTTGRVGIGTTTPNQALDVVGTIQASNDVCIAGGGNCLSDISGGGGGGGPLSCQTVTDTDVSGGTAIAYCPAGTTVTGGGCTGSNSEGGPSGITALSPTSTVGVGAPPINGWLCKGSEYVRVYAICCSGGGGASFQSCTIDGQILKYDLASDSWECADDSDSIGAGNIVKVGTAYCDGCPGDCDGPSCPAGSTGSYTGCYQGGSRIYYICVQN